MSTTLTATAMELRATPGRPMLGVLQRKSAFSPSGLYYDAPPKQWPALDRIIVRVQTR